MLERRSQCLNQILCSLLIYIYICFLNLGTTMEENIVDDGQRKQNMKLYYSRCSPIYFKDAVEELKPI